MNDIVSIIFQILGCVALGVVCVVGIRVCRKFNIEIDDKRLTSVISVIGTIVDYVSQTIKKNMKNDNMSNTGVPNLTGEQKMELFRTTSELISSSITQDQKDLLAKYYGTYRTAIDTLIESIIYNDDNNISITNVEPIILTPENTEVASKEQE